MNMLIAPDEGYIPEYTRTDLTDKLHDTFVLERITRLYLKEK